MKNNIIQQTEATSSTSEIAPPDTIRQSVEYALGAQHLADKRPRLANNDKTVLAVAYLIAAKIKSRTAKLYNAVKDNNANLIARYKDGQHIYLAPGHFSFLVQLHLQKAFSPMFNNADSMQYVMTIEERRHFISIDLRLDRLGKTSSFEERVGYLINDINTPAKFSVKRKKAACKIISDFLGISTESIHSKKITKTKKTLIQAINKKYSHIPNSEDKFRLFISDVQNIKPGVFVRNPLKNYRSPGKLQAFIHDSYVGHDPDPAKRPSSHRHMNAVKQIISNISSVYRGYKGSIYYTDTNDKAQELTCNVFGADDAFHLGTIQNLYPRLAAPGNSLLITRTQNQDITHHRVLILPVELMRLQQYSVNTLVNKPHSGAIASVKHNLKFPDYIQSNQISSANGKLVNNALEKKREKQIDKVVNYLTTPEISDYERNDTVNKIFNRDFVAPVALERTSKALRMTPVLEEGEEGIYHLTFPSIKLFLNYRVHHEKEMIAENLYHNAFIGRSFSDFKTRGLKQDDGKAAVMNLDGWLKSTDDVNVTYPSGGSFSNNSHFSATYEQLTIHHIDPCPAAVRISGKLYHLEEYLDSMRTADTPTLMEKGCREPAVVATLASVAYDLVTTEQLLPMNCRNKTEKDQWRKFISKRVDDIHNGHVLEY